MNRKEKYLYDMFKISYLDKKAFEKKIYEVFILSHIDGANEFTPKELQAVVDTFTLSKKEFKREVDRFYKHSKKVHWILHNMWFILSDKRCVICWGEWWYCLFHFIKYDFLLATKLPDYEYNFADEIVFLVKGVENAAGYLDAEPDVLAAQTLEEYFEGNKSDENGTEN